MEKQCAVQPGSRSEGTVRTIRRGPLAKAVGRPREHAGASFKGKGRNSDPSRRS